eukprot:1586065-Pyramimonas_sp.AAC.1
MIRTAKLAVLFFGQPSGGSAVWDGHIKCPAGEGGCARQEAKVRDLVMHWQDWSPRRRQNSQVDTWLAPIQGTIDR